MNFFFFNKNCKYFLIISKRINLFVCWVKILRGKQISLKNRISTRPHSIRFASEDIVVLSNVKLVREPTRWDSKPLTFITSILKLSKTTSLDFHSSPSLSLSLSSISIFSPVLFSCSVNKNFPSAKKSRTLISVFPRNYTADR